MPFGSPSRRCGVLLGTVVVCVLFLFVLAPLTRAEAESPLTPKLVVTVSDTTGPAGTVNSVITVYLDNYQDSIAAFTLWLRLDRPDICRFQIDTVLVKDTTYWKCTAFQNSKCIDSIAMPKDSAGKPGVYRVIRDTLVQIGSIDKTGTIIANWDYVVTRSVTGNGTDILVNAIANTFQAPDPLNPPPLGYGSGRKLFKLLADILPISDTATQRTAKILVEHAFLDKFIFSKPNGTAIGVYQRAVVDTECYRCQAYSGGKCVSWLKVSSPPCDSTKIVTEYEPTLDTTYVQITNGSLTATKCCYSKTGNVNLAGIVDLSDLSLLIAYLTQTVNRPTLPCPKSANVNALGIVDLSDLSLLIAYLTVTPRPTLPNCPL